MTSIYFLLKINLKVNNCFKIKQMADLDQFDEMKRRPFEAPVVNRWFLKRQSMKKFAKFIEKLMFDISLADLITKCSLMTRECGYKNSVEHMIKEDEKRIRVEQKPTPFSLKGFLKDFPTKQEILDQLVQFRFENIDLL